MRHEIAEAILDEGSFDLSLDAKSCHEKG